MDAAELEQLVRANIQDVISMCEQPEAPQAAPSRVPEHNQQPAQASSVAASGTLQQVDATSLMDVPQNSEATIRLLKARIRALEEQLGAALRANQEKDVELSELQKQARLQLQREATGSKAQKSLEAQVERHRKAAEAAREALAAKEQQIKELSKDGAKADKDRRLVEAESRARDVRLQRALEEVDKYKQLLLEVKHQGQEVKDVAKSEASRAVNEVKRLERHKGELMAVLRKQTKLIEVLRRQRAHLEAARLLAFTEEEFLQLLDGA